MNDEKAILAQVHELQVIVNKLCAVKIDLPVPFQVGVIIAKLPSSWNGYRKKLLHNSEDYSLEQLMKHLRIEEESRVRENLEKVSIGSSSRAHVVAFVRSRSNGGVGNKCGRLPALYPRASLAR